MAWAWLLGIQPDSLKQGNKSHQLRRLRLYSFIVRTPHSHRYEDTFAVLRTGSFFTRTDAQLLRPSLSHHIVAAPRHARRRPLIPAPQPGHGPRMRGGMPRGIASLTKLDSIVARIPGPSPLVPWRGTVSRYHPPSVQTKPQERTRRNSKPTRGARRTRQAATGGTHLRRIEICASVRNLDPAVDPVVIGNRRCGPSSDAEANRIGSGSGHGGAGGRERRQRRRDGRCLKVQLAWQGRNRSTGSLIAEGVIEKRRSGRRPEGGRSGAGEALPRRHCDGRRWIGEYEAR